MAQRSARGSSNVIPGKADATQLLIKSYLTGRNLPPEPRTYLLTLLSDAAIQIEPSLTRLWAQEAFQATFKLPMNWDRVAHQKNALVALAGVDPVLSFELFEAMEPTVSFSSGYIPEDLRAYGARTIFIEYWKCKGYASLGEIRRQAMRLGDTGQYPFLAMEPIIRDVHRQDEPEAHTLIGEALAHYVRARRAANTDDEFSQFLQKLWEVTPPTLQLQALQALVRNITDQPAPPGNRVFFSSTQTERGAIEFTSPMQKLLYSLLPRIREVDRRWADELVDQQPALQRASAASGSEISTEQVTIENMTGAPAKEISAIQAYAFQKQKADRISKLVQLDPSQALAMVTSITDRGLRNQVLASIAEALASTDRVQARTLVGRIRKDMELSENSRERMAILAALARAAGANQEHSLLSEILERGMDLGEELSSEDHEVHPGKAVEDVDGFGSLADLTATGMKHFPDFILGRIDRISNEMLRAHLVLKAAQALHIGQRGPQ